MSLKSMENLILFMKREGSTDDFYRIFRIPFPNKPDIEDVIRDFIEVLGNYSNFAERIEENEKMKKRYEPLEQYSADILGYIATSIKLAGEGHVGESLAILRSAIDVFITSLFTSLTWIPYTSEDINPLADAFESPYYHRMKEISLDDILVNKIGIGEESEGKLLKDQIIKISRSLFKNYLNGMEIKENKIEPSEQIRYLGEIRRTLNQISLALIRKDNKWFKELEMQSISPENFLGALMADERYAFKACGDHENNLLNRLKRNLEIGEEMTEELKKVLIEELTFKFDIEQIAKQIPEGDLPLCDDCEKHPLIWSIHVRLDKNSMTKYIEKYLDKNSLTKINECVKLSLKKKEKYVLFKLNKL